MHVVRVVAGVHHHAHQARHASSHHPQHPQHVIYLPAGPQVPALVVRSQSLVVSRTLPASAPPSISRTAKQLAPLAALRQLVKLQQHTSKHLLLQHAHAQRLPAARPRQRAVLAFAPSPGRAVDRHSSSSSTKAAAICLPWPELAALPARRTLQAILQHKPPSSSVSVSRASAAAALARVKPGTPPLLRAPAAAAPAPAGRDAKHGRLPCQSRAAAAAASAYSLILVGSAAARSPTPAAGQAPTRQAAAMCKQTSELCSAGTREPTAAAAAACSSGGGAGGNSAAAGSGSGASTSGEGSTGSRLVPQGAPWGNPIGGTLFVNPDCQSVAAEHQPAPASTATGTGGASSHSRSPNTGSNDSASPGSSTGGSDGGATGRSQSQSGSPAVGPGRLRAAAALAAAAPTTQAPGLRLSVSPAAAPAAVAAASRGVAAAIPTPLVVKLGVLLMGAAAATALAGLWYTRGGGGSSSSSSEAALAGVAGTTTTGAAVGLAARVPPAAAGGAAEAALPGYTRWMVARLSSTVKQFEDESAMLSAELSMLQALQQQATGASGGMATRLRAWLTWRGSSRAGGGGEGGPAAVAAAAAAAGGGGQLSEPDLSPAGIATRMASLREQLQTLEVLRAALTAELRDHQQQQLQQQQGD